MKDKQTKMIESLPNNPNKLIIWIVYNEDMVDQAEKRIRYIKGDEYMSKIKVVPRTRASKWNGHIYFDPNLYDLIGNGND